MPVKKRNSDNSAKESSSGDPYDQRTIVITIRGVRKSISALNLHFVTKRTFISYEPPPYFPHMKRADGSLHDLNSIRGFPESVDIEEWLAKMDYFKEDLHWLLGLPYHKFWSQVIYDEDLQACLVSYLTQAPRYYDLKNPIVTVEMEKMSKEIHRLVFLVFLRMSTHKESQDCHLTPSVHGDYIYNYHLFDVPKMMDLCVLFGRENKAVLQKAIEAIFKVQPLYTHDLQQCLRCIPQSFDSVQEQLGLIPSVCPDQIRLDVQNPEATIKTITWEQLEDIISYITDTSATLCTFQEIYPKTCHAMHQESLETTFADFYESVFPLIVEEIGKRLGNINCEISVLQKQLGFAKSCFLKLFRGIIQECYMTPILENSSSGANDARIQLVDKYLDVISSVLMEKRPSFICDYELKYPFEDDIEIMMQLSFPLDQDRIDYIYKSISASFESLNRKWPHNAESHISSDSTNMGHSEHEVTHNGAVSDQVKMSSSNHAYDIDYLSLDGACAGPIPAKEEIEQLVAKVISMLPHLSIDFVEASLEYYNYDSERVIDAILEENLPPSLCDFERNKSRQEDKHPVLSERRNIYDNDKFDVFTQNSIDMSCVHKGKRDSTPKTLDSFGKDERAIAVTKAMISSVEVATYEDDLLYEDEYDDTYDSNMIGPSDDTLEEELLLRRPFQKPRVLESSTDREGQEEEPTSKSEEEEEEEMAGERRKEAHDRVKDEFVPNPEVLREAAARKHQMRNNQRRVYDVQGRPKGHGQDETTLRNRNKKKQNKAHVANHNRRVGAERKRRQGMIPT